ncbi:hypothetical protein ACLB1N_15740 [Escherichia coli]
MYWHFKDKSDLFSEIWGTVEFRSLVN